MINNKEEFLFFVKRGLANIKEDLAELKKITDLTKFREKVSSDYQIHRNNFYELKAWYDSNNLYEEGNDLDNKKLENMYKELKELVSELKSLADKAYCNQCQKEITSPHYSEKEFWKPKFCSQDCFLKSKSSTKDNNTDSKSKPNDVEIITCAKCQQIIQSGEMFWFNSTNNDGKKFCSINHYNQYYQVDNNRKKKQEPIKQTLPLFTCPQCQQRTNTEIIWEIENAQDNKQFCSKNCCRDYYQVNPLCDECGRVNPAQWFTWNNLQEHDKLLVEYLTVWLGKSIQKNYDEKYCLPDCLWKASGISQALKGWTYDDWKLYDEWVARKRKNNNQKIVDNTEINDKTSNINKSDMSSIEREREREREQIQLKSNTLLYVSLGITGAIALIGGLVYFFIKRKGEKNNHG